MIFPEIVKETSRIENPWIFWFIVIVPEKDGHTGIT
jgi:hypothetical protein